MQRPEHGPGTLALSRWRSNARQGQLFRAWGLDMSASQLSPQAGSALAPLRALARPWGPRAQRLGGRQGKAWESESHGLEDWEKSTPVPKGCA